jgi:hypothetical protein
MMDRLNLKRHSEDSYGDYYQCLLESSHKAEEARKTHDTWKRRHWDGITLSDCEHRILVVLRELLKSDFFHADYFDTGVPKADCRQAHKDLTEMGFYELGELEGADWKYALFCRVLRKRGEKRILIDTEAAGLYIDEMYGELGDDAIEAFFRFAMFTMLAYEEIDRLGAVKKEPIEKKSPEQKAVEDFVRKIIRLANIAYEKYNGQMVSPGVNKADVEIVIMKDKLISRMQSRMKNDFDELLALCYPENARSKARLCQYVRQLKLDGFFGKLPNNLLAELLAPIVGLKEGSVKNYLSQT